MRSLVRVAGLIAMVGALELAGCKAPPPPTPVEARDSCITLLATNDLHGTLEPRRHGTGDRVVREGGIPLLASYIAAARATAQHPILLLDAGDMYRGSFASDHFEGRPTIAAMSALHYDAGVLGNHEFDFGPGATGMDMLDVVKRRVAEAGFPILAANVYDRASGQRIAWPNTRPSLLKKIGHLDVGIIGISTVETPTTTFPKNVAALEFREPAPIVQAEAEALRKQGAKLIVLVGHVGMQCAKIDNPKDASSCDAQTEMVRLLTVLPKGTVDVAVAGHTHRDVAHWIAGVPVIESSSYARKLGRIDLCTGPSGGLDIDGTTIRQPVPLCATTWSDGTCGDEPSAAGGAIGKATYEGKEITPDADIQKLLAPYFKEVEVLKSSLVGIRLPAPMPRAATADSVGNNMVRGLAELGNTPLAIHNLGGVRNDLPAGDLTFGAIYDVAPFGNHVAVLTLKKRELEELVKILTLNRKEPPYMYGFTMKLVGDTVKLLAPNGRPLRDGVFKVATTDFIALGGDGVGPALADVGPNGIEILAAIDRDALMTALRARFPGPLPQRVQQAP